MLFNRFFELNIQVGDHAEKKYSGTDNMLQFDFQVTKTIGGIGEQANITLYGLPLKDIQYLCTSIRARSEGTPLKVNTIQLTAGYVDEYGVIFNGGIFDVQPSLDSSDLSVKLTCTAGLQKRSENSSESANTLFEISEKNYSFLDICRKLAEKMNVPIEIRDETEDSILDSVSISRTCLQTIEELRAYKKMKYNIYFTGGKLIVEDRHKGQGNKIIKLSNMSGLIGTPQPTIAGCNVKSLLRPSLEAGGHIEVESTKLPMVNGVYRISNLTHNGSSRGSQFYSNMQCTRWSV